MTHPTSLNTARLMMLQILRASPDTPISAIQSKLQIVGDYLDEQVAPEVLKNENMHYCMPAGKHTPLPDTGCKDCNTFPVDVAAAPPCYLCAAAAAAKLLREAALG